MLNLSRFTRFSWGKIWFGRFAPCNRNSVHNPQSTCQQLATESECLCHLEAHARRPLFYEFEPYSSVQICAAVSAPYKSPLSQRYIHIWGKCQGDWKFKVPNPSALKVNASVTGRHTLAPTFSPKWNWTIPRCAPCKSPRANIWSKLQGHICPCDICPCDICPCAAHWKFNIYITCTIVCTCICTKCLLCANFKNIQILTYWCLHWS